MSITFAVDRVETVTTPIAQRALDRAASALIGMPLIAVSHDAKVIGEPAPWDGVPNALLTAVHRAFAEHRPLSLSPDHVWMAIEQGFAIHLDEHGERLRSRFVRHEGKKELLVEVEREPERPEDWAEAIAAFNRGIVEHVGPGLHRLLACSFSTTTHVERTASEVVMMSAFQRYFDYLLVCICGIPAITLEGTTEDWIEIRRRVDVIAEYELEWWARALRPICDQLVETSRGKIDKDFWQCIYKPEERYGGEDITGWIARLFPYVGDGPRVQNSAVLEAGAKVRGRDAWISAPMNPEAVPSPLSSAPLRFVHVDGKERTLYLYGGFFGVAQLASGALRPEIGWAISEPPPMTAVLDRIVKDHRTTPVLPRDEQGGARELPKEMLELYARVGSAKLFDRFEVRPRNELHLAVGSTDKGFKGLDAKKAFDGGYRPSEDLVVAAFCDLAGDRRFIAIHQAKRSFPVVLCDPTRALDVEDIPVLADDVCAFFELVLKHKGTLWFDAPDFRPSATLYDRLGYHAVLRKAVREDTGVDPLPLNAREAEQLIFRLCERKGSKKELLFWWGLLESQYSITKSFDEMFKKKRMPIEIMEELGLRSFPVDE